MTTSTRVTVTKGELDMTISLDVTDCAACGVIFATSGRYLAERRSDKRQFFCPNGHSMGFNETEADKLRSQLAKTERQLQYANDTADRIARERDHAKSSLTATKGVVTRMKRRAMAGACVYCHKPFQDLRDHMAAIHPDVTIETDPAGS